MRCSDYIAYCREARTADGNVENFSIFFCLLSVPDLFSRVSVECTVSNSGWQRRGLHSL